MRSPRTFLAAAFILLALPTALLCQVLFGAGSEVTIHLMLATGSALLAAAVFDFPTPPWTNWLGSVASGALAAIFLIQGIALAVRDKRLSHLSFAVLGQWPEGILGALVVGWLAMLLLLDSHGATRILGYAAVVPAIGFEAVTLVLRLEDRTSVAAAGSFKLLLLLPFVWLLGESAKRRVVS